MVPFRYLFSITAVCFLLFSQPVHALMDKEGSDCHHTPMGLNSIRSAFQKWENGRKNPETYRELAPKALIEHYRSWQEYNKRPAHTRDDRAAQAMISTFRRWNEAR